MSTDPTVCVCVFNFFLVENKNSSVKMLYLAQSLICSEQSKYVTISLNLLFIPSACSLSARNTASS